MIKFFSLNSKSSLSLGNVAAVASIAVFGTWQYYRQKQKDLAKDEYIEAKYSQRLPFLPYDASFRSVRRAGMTWFEGDMQQVAEYVRDRIGKMLAANPWLTSEITVYKGKNCMVFNNADGFDVAKEIERSFVIVKSKDHNLTIESTREEVGNYYYERLRNRDRVWRVYIIPAADNPNQFCLISDLEHVAGDGYTRGRLYRMMISESETIVAMNPVRLTGLETVLQDLLGARQIRLVNSLATLYHYYLYKFLKNQTYIYQDFLLDTDEIKKIKSTINPEKEGVPYVTTNDIVSSWILQDTSCRYMRLFVNLRSLSPKIDKDLCGNYVSSVLLTSDNGMATPANIRKQVKSLGLPDSELPHPFSTLIGGMHCIMNNRSAAVGLDRLAPPGCVELKYSLLLHPNTNPPTGGFFSIERYKEGVLVLTVMCGFGMKPVPCPPFAKPISM